MRLQLRHILLAATLCVTTSISAFELNGIFSDHMVLQRNKPIRIYGTGNAGETLTVTLGEGSGKTKVESTGSWIVELPARKASADPMSLSVSDGTKTTQLSDIVIGDVWVCSGQSNMGWGVSNTQPLPKSYPHADKLRLINGQLVVSPAKALNQFTTDNKNFPNGWQRAEEEHALNISAVSYYMGLEICKQADIPVGIVVVALGGSQIYPWMTPDSINGHPEENTARDEAERSLNWAKGKAKELIAQGQQEKAEKLLYSYEGKAPSALYNGMIHPLTQMPIAGMLWYQGERSQDNPLPYRTFFPAAIKGWRQAWNQGDFPFIFIQLPAYFGSPGRNERRARGFSLVREAQELALKLPNTGMAMALDYGHKIEVHPQEKHEVGRRAGLQALRLMGKNIVADGPVKEGIKINGATATIAFSSVAKGLETREVKLPQTKKKIGSNDPNPCLVPADTLHGFEVCGTDKVFKAATARITNTNTVEIKADGVSQIKHIRYAFHQFPLCNLYNSEGLPARPFRTDDFPVAYGQ